MLLEHGRMVYWKKWAATHECEELKEEVWLQPIQAYVAKEEQGSVDRQAPKCNKEAGRRRRMGA